MHLSETEKERVRRDFLDWSGGFTPSEVEPQEIDLYVDVAMPSDLDPDAVEDFLSIWVEEGDTANKGDG